MSMKKAPTAATAKKASGAIPYFAQTASIFAIALGVAPRPKPACPAVMTAA